jgi:hypothetical protein
MLQIIAANRALRSFVDDGFGVVTTGTGNFASPARSLFDAGFFLADAFQALAQYFPRFIVDASIGFDELCIGTAIAADGFTRGKCLLPLTEN